MKQRRLKMIVICLFAAGANFINAQTTIKGSVVNKSNEPVPGATVQIKGNADAVTADSSGNFLLHTDEKGKRIVRVSSTGYIPAERSINLDDLLVSINFILRTEAKELGEVVVNAGSFEASDKAKGASLTPMDAVTVAGNGGDVANSLRWLPGTQQLGEREGLFVRGGTGDEAKQFIDGTVLPHPNFSPVPGIQQPARLNPFLFRGILFSSGGYSAAYGQAMSSALILETTDIADEASGNLHIFPQDAGVGWQGLSKNKQSSYGLSTHYGNLHFYNSIIPQQPDFFHGPEYFTGDGHIHVKTSKTGMLKFYANYQTNNTGMRSRDVDSAALYSAYQTKGKNLYTNLSYRESPGRNWKIDAAASYNNYREDVKTELQNADRKPVLYPAYPYSEKNRKINEQSGLWQLKSVITKRFRGNKTLRFGAEYWYNKEEYDFNDTVSKLPDNFLSAFAEGDIQFNKSISVRAGIRSEYSSLLKQLNFAPRINAAYKFNKGGQINFAYGIFYQQPGIIYLLQNRDLGYSRASHYILNYQRKEGNRFFRIEAYYKQYKNLLSTSPVVNNSGDGYASGIELFWRDKKTFKNFDYWVTYTYLNTKRKFLNYPVSLRPDFSTPHTASLVIKRYFQDINFDANLSYTIATGRPYYNIRPGAGGSTFIADKGTTDWYNGMNLSFAYLFTMFKKGPFKDFSGIGFGVNNVFGTKQVFGYNYSFDGLNKQPVTLPAARSYYFGLFMSFGVDRREDFINDNL